ncbi:MAG: nuclear transport factor 2 family protein [Rhizobiales bacterium]|nr:nuclear transport factor 2 family protein [Hyphomicrobiales bacterium]
MTIDAELLTANRALVAALAKREATAAISLLDDDFTWIDSQGREFGKQQATRNLPQPPLTETGLIPLIHRYGEVASVAVEREKIFVLRIWVHRAQGWRLLAYHEVSQRLPAAPHGPGRKDWDNPCRTLPYEPRNADERDCIAAWQRLETAVMTHDAEEWSRHVADEFLVVGATRRHSKADRKAVIEEQKRTDTNSAPAPLVSARLFGFPDAMVMACEHQPFHGKAARVSRIFVKRDGQWLMAVSFQTTRQDAPVKSI